MTAGSAGPEFGLFVVASPAGDRILDRARALFDVRRVYDLHWTPALAAQNYARFYRQRPGAGANGALERLLLVTAVDSTTGHAKFREATQEFRSWTPGPASVHGSTTPAEAARDLLLLLGTDPRTHLTENPRPWDGRIAELQRDLSGARGWTSPTELFHALNHTVPYVVLPWTLAGPCVEERNS